ELEPLARTFLHSLANEVVNRYINDVLRALPEHWIRMAGVYLPDPGSPLRYWRSGLPAHPSSRRPAAAGRVTGCSTSSVRRGQWTICCLRTTSRRRESG